MHDKFWSRDRKTSPESSQFSVDIQREVGYDHRKTENDQEAEEGKLHAK